MSALHISGRSAWISALVAGAALAAPLPETPHQLRPAWWRESGVVAAGAWEPLIYRLRSGAPENAAVITERWNRAFNEQTARKLKDAGFNLLIIPLYKGFGLKAERSGMEASKRFADICHRLGLRVGCYMFSGTIAYESLLAENPDAREWMIRDERGEPLIYMNQYFRRWVNRSHPGVGAHVRELVRYAVEELRADLLHFDNYMVAPAYEPYSVAQFRVFLDKKYSPAERLSRFGFPRMDFIEPPHPPTEPDLLNTDPLYQDFLDYRCETMAETYREAAEYARSLSPGVVMECNPHGYYGELGNFGSLKLGSVDHSRMLGWGGAFWDEGSPSGLRGPLLQSRFRSHKLGRQFDNMVMQYTPTRVSMAESMANNLQSAGCAAWFENGEIIGIPPRLQPTIEPGVLDYIRFFHANQQYYRDAVEIADVGVLNTYAGIAYGPAATRHAVSAFEQLLYQSRVPFTLVPGRYPGDLGRFKALVLADVALMPETLVNAVRDYVLRGGGLVMTGKAGHFDENHHRRRTPGLNTLFPAPPANTVLRAKPGKGRAVYLPDVKVPANFKSGMLPENGAELLDAVRWASGGSFTAEAGGAGTVAMALYGRPGGRRVMHLVNYDPQSPQRNVRVMVRNPGGGALRVTWLSPDGAVSAQLKGKQDGEELVFTVPRLDIYGLAILDGLRP